VLNLKDQDAFWSGEGRINGKRRTPPSRAGRHGLGFFYGEESKMERIAVIGAILEAPDANQRVFNETVSSYRGIVKGRMGIPFDGMDVAVISLTLQGELDMINALTGKLGNLPGVTVKTAISGELKGENHV
jgi:putative iron-only hydrogenase system regulator